MGRKAFIGWNIFMYKQCFLLKLSLAMMIKESAIFFNHKEISVCRHFYDRKEIFYLRNTVFIYMALCRDKILYLLSHVKSLSCILCFNFPASHAYNIQ